jgi:hypothetical protein
MSDKELEEIFQKQWKLKNKLLEHDIKYIPCVWPNKHSIYRSEYPVSMRLQVENETSIADQILDYLLEKNFLFVDVRLDLLREKEKNQVYYKFDTHWNDIGAYKAYRAFCEQTFSELALIPYHIDDFFITMNELNRGDLVSMLGLDSIAVDVDQSPRFSLKAENPNYQIISSEGFPKQTIVTQNTYSENEEIVLVFHDSFFYALRQFFSLHYRKVVYIWTYPKESHPIDKESIIEQVDPDIIINSCVERYLLDLLE